MTSRLPLWLGVVFAIVAFATSFSRLSEVGITWDEVRYFESAERIQAWTDSLVSGPDRSGRLSAETIRQAWDVDRYFNPHPPVYKEGMAISEALLGQRFGSLTGYRTSSLAMFALLVGLVAGLTASLVRPTAGVGAGLALLLMPRVLGHAHIAATDIPLTLFWFVAAVGLFQFVRDDNRWWLLAGAVGLGLALATKFTGWLAPAPLLGWMALYGRSRARVTGFLLLIGFAFVVAVVVNPAAWHDPIGYQQRLFFESMGRETTVPIATFYMGRIWEFSLPWHHAPVMSLITMPVGTAGLFLVSLFWVFRRGPVRALAVLCAIQVVFWMVLIGLPGSPNHDGVRMWLPMFPFVAILAGIAFGQLVEALRRRVPPGGPEVIGTLLLTSLLFFPAFLGTARSSPYMLSYYGELIGGPSGAAEAGMEATYWFDAMTPAFLERIEQELPDSAVVVAIPNTEYFEQLQNLGLLRDDLRFTKTTPADYLLLLARRALFTPAMAGIYGTVPPILAVELDGVELVGLYRWVEPSDQDDENEETP
jgi:4-amino-4-deoxy-L-arabinose transferase-like glycosyltransferase